MVQDEAVRFTLRLVPELNKKLEIACRKQGIAKNALIVNILWSHIDKKAK